jgi:capsular exopolysaccharide synthesis family protein
MSRVEEARRRAAGRDLEDRSYPDSSFSGADLAQSVLQEYPRERRSAECLTVSQSSRPIAAPRTTSSGQLGSLDAALDGKLVGSPDTPASVIEQYRRLAASLHELQVDTGLKTMMVTSAMPREGKTLTVTNLALTLSESYRRRVLLIDADLRRPSLHDVFRLPKTTGLSEALRSGSRPHLLELSPLLSVLPAGELEGDPLGALTSDRLPALVEHCTAAFDWVLLDAPPIGLMPDGSVLARLTKAVVFVISAGVTPQRVVERAIAEIGRDNIVGTVLNRIEDRQMPTDSQHYEAYTATNTTRR